MALGWAAAVRIVKRLVPTPKVQHMASYCYLIPGSGLQTANGAVVIAGKWHLERELSGLALAFDMPFVCKGRHSATAVSTSVPTLLKEGLAGAQASSQSSTATHETSLQQASEPLGSL